MGVNGHLSSLKCQSKAILSRAACIVKLENLPPCSFIRLLVMTNNFILILNGRKYKAMEHGAISCPAFLVGLYGTQG